MKITKKICAALLLIGILVLGLSSCRKEGSEVPEGFITATCYGANYRLYVPSTWVANNTYGVSAAYRNSVEQSSVSVHRYETGAETEAALAGKDRLPTYWETVLLPVIREQALGADVNFVEEDCLPTVFGGINAVQRHVTADVGGQVLHFLQVVAERGGAFYVFTYLANEQYYSVTRGEVDRMIEEFVFSDEPYEPDDYVFQLEKDENVPDGMRVAYSKDVPYRFYVPQDWEIDQNRLICSAWDPADRTNVSVLPYSPQESMGIKDYFSQEIASMEENRGIGNVAVLSEAESEIGGRKCMVYEFTCTVDGIAFRYRQYIAVYQSRFYCVTYTATDAAFEAHLDDLAAIVSHFSFR